MTVFHLNLLDGVDTKRIEGVEIRTGPDMELPEKQMDPEYQRLFYGRKFQNERLATMLELQEGQRVSQEVSKRCAKLSLERN